MGRADVRRPARRVVARFPPTRGRLCLPENTSTRPRSGWGDEDSARGRGTMDKTSVEAVVEDAARGTGSRLLRRAQDAVKRVGVGYSPQEHRQLRGHLGAVATFGAYTALWGVALRTRKPRLPDPPDLRDVLFIAAATFRLSRLLSKGTVTSPLRAPFTTFESMTGPAEVRECPRGGRIRSTVGELVTCPFCLSVWMTATMTGAHLLWPRGTRVVTRGLTALAAADTMQLGYDCLVQKTIE